MPAKDIYHELVKQALIKAGWTITHDPFSLPWAKRNLSIDLGAEKLLAAENEERKIVVEVKSFLRDSRVADLEQALGQYILYNDILKLTHPERELYLAMPSRAFTDIFEGAKFGKILLDNNRLKLIVFNIDTEEIIEWLP
ncbi:MAG: XisH family protein [Cyanobacteriota bacterium]|nr:XisH family protein [Cyanobacteriota bacterium]